MNVEHNSDYTSCRAVHAEMNAVIQGTAAEMNGATLYLHGENVCQNNMQTTPELVDELTIDWEEIDCCPMCKRAIINAGIKRVVMSSGVNYEREYLFEVDVSDFIKEMNGENGDWVYDMSASPYHYHMKRRFET
jgi:dCMP deaminase